MSEAEVPTDGPAYTSKSGRPRLRVHLGALLIFSIATVVTYGELWQRGASSEVVFKTWGELESSSWKGLKLDSLGHAARADVIFESWLVARNARTLATRPLRLFDTEQCAPAEKTLTLGIPMITMGVLAIPTWFATGDPILTFNVTTVALNWVAALAMYWLVMSWTGVPAAGMIAGLLYAFHPIRVMQVMHPSVWDSAWAVFALVFAERLFAMGRWRDVLGLVASIAFQIGASFYSLLAAVFLTPSFGIWLLLRDRLRHVSVLQLGIIAFGTALAAALLLGPYLLVPAAGKLAHDPLSFAVPANYLPGGRAFPGWVLLTLALVGALWPRGSWLRIAGDPRPALLVGAVFVALVAAGPTLPETLAPFLPEILTDLVPDLWGAFSAVLPGLGAVRIVERLLQGVLVALCIVAGLGAAALIQRSGRFNELFAALLLLFAAADTLRGAGFGLEQRFAFRYTDIRPSEADRSFFRALERRGNRGPILEVPILQTTEILAAPPRILLSTFHGRRTSACFGSYLPPVREELTRLAGRLPKPAAVKALVGLGFTTVVFHHPLRPDPLRRARPQPEHIRRIYSKNGKTAYALIAK